MGFKFASILLNPKSPVEFQWACWCLQENRSAFGITLVWQNKQTTKKVDDSVYIQTVGISSFGAF